MLSMAMPLQNEIIYDMKVLKMLRNYTLVDIKSISELKISDESITAIINSILKTIKNKIRKAFIL